MQSNGHVDKFAITNDFLFLFNRTRVCACISRVYVLNKKLKEKLNPTRLDRELENIRATTLL